MNILLIGPQGSGKGTQARLLIEKYGYYYFESGEFLRKVAETNDDLKKSLAKGKMVPDKEMTSYLAAFLDEKNLYDDIIFDGFPRTVDQYNFFKNWLSDKKVHLDLIIVLIIDEEETLRRLTARRMDPKTGEIYNLVTEPPPAGVDPNTLVQRDDDKPEAIKKRLALYRQRTKPLITELKKDTKVIEVNGERPVGIIAQEIDGIVAKNHDQNQN
ncbi:MAG: Adenylate kinase [Candidatus Woesebacteria bacterium GW2011_GWA2_40_7b]|uniref:Adenylate kinase n=1 Tax=Candidatus Woesebacteria bacterium GW2011_GWA2_40_7b TaxID=1618563 RepID=A0A0G0VCL1_9BACT|nr:MAG: Adenylate kinase [Candidatus Woesebacteria bacterium GW2011_GWA2_40_7b]